MPVRAPGEGSRRWPAQRSLRAWALLAIAPGIATVEAYPYVGNCGVEIPHPADAGREGYHSIGGGTEDPEDSFWSLDPGDMDTYKRLRVACAEPLDRNRCRTFGLSQWNLSAYWVAALEGDSFGKAFSAEDKQLLDQLKGIEGGTTDRCNLRSPACKQIGGQARVVSLMGLLSRHNTQLMARLPHLFSLFVTSVPEHEHFEELELPSSLRLLTLRSVNVEEDVSKLAPLLQRHAQLQSLAIHGPFQSKRWQRLDLSQFCGLDLRRFAAFGVNVSEIPACWSEMKNLEAFWCPNCMMTSPPVALKGSQSLKSFVAFRQSEMIPCVYKELRDSIGPCKPSWETLTKIKHRGRYVSNGRHEDFAQGPSYMCEREAYALPFDDFVSLGWTNIEKVWLDGNFMTGEIPKDIAKVWPSLQSLDLYENEMSGEIPESMADLDLVKLQLNGNDFSGRLPAGIAMKLHNHLHLGVAGNPRLQGCIPHTMGMAQTQLRTCANDEL